MKYEDYKENEKDVDYDEYEEDVDYEEYEENVEYEENEENDGYREREKYDDFDEYDFPRKKTNAGRLMLIPAGLCLLFFLASLGLKLTLQPTKYETEAAGLTAQADALRAEAAELEAEMDERAASLREDISAAGAEGEKLAGQLAQLQADREAKSAELEAKEAEIELLGGIQERTYALRTQYGEKIRELEDKIVAGESKVKIVYWTFDDGPSIMTAQFLDKLRELGVYATFFTSHDANESSDEEEMLRREILDGHTVANHSYSHQYNANVYSSLDSFREQVRQQDEYVYETTGFHTDIFRFPAGSNYARGLKEDAIAALGEMGYGWVDWHTNSYDAGATPPTAKAEAANIVWETEEMIKRGSQITVLLSHDMYQHTLDALPIAVERLKALGYVFLPLLPQSVTMGTATPNFG